MNEKIIDTAIVLAGGLGTRLRAVVPDLPKPMAPINGRPFLEYLFDYWRAQGIKRFILSIGYRAEIIRKHFGNAYRDMRIDYSEEASPLGTGGGLLMAAGLLESEGAAVLVLNGDTFFAVEICRLAEFHQHSQADWTFCVFRTTESGRYLGIDLAPNGRLVSFRTERNAGERVANGGVYLVSRPLLTNSGYPAGVPVSLEEQLFPSLLEKRYRFYGKEFPGDFIDIGIPEDYHRAAAILGIRHD